MENAISKLERSEQINALALHFAITANNGSYITTEYLTRTTLRFKTFIATGNWPVEED